MTKRSYGKPVIDFVNNTERNLDDATFKTLNHAVDTVLRLEGFDAPAQVSLVITDNAEIRSLNKKHRKIDKETDVLSFPNYAFAPPDFDTSDITPPVYLGDIVISIEKAESQADEYGHSILRELAFLTVHSTLHLLGYDHENNADDERAMITKQKQALDIEMSVIS